MMFIAAATLASVIAAAHYSHKFTKKMWVAWVAGILAFVFVVLIFGPVREALKRVSCRGADDYQACIDGEDDGNSGP